MDAIVGKIRIIGNQYDVNSAQEIMPDVSQMSEGDARIRIQATIDHFKLNATILYGGNTVWSFDRIIRDFKRVLKADSTEKMTKNLYQFFSLCCGTIAHFSREGWATVYPDKAALQKMFLGNEFGKRVLDDIPRWKTDAIKIVSEMETLLGIA